MRLIPIVVVTTLLIGCLSCSSDSVDGLDEASTDSSAGEIDVDTHVTTQGAFSIVDSGRVVSLEVATDTFAQYQTGLTGYDVVELTPQVIELFGDQFDYIVFMLNTTTNLSKNFAAWHRNVSNDVDGIGRNLFNDGETYGSDGKLKAVIAMQLSLGLSVGTLHHEILHTWGHYLFDDYVDTAVNAASLGHAGFSSLDSYIGGWSADTLQNLGSNQYYATAGVEGATTFQVNGSGVLGNKKAYNNFELYLMGLIPSTEVEDVSIAINPQWIDPNNGVFSASKIETITIDDIINKHGERIPSYLDSQKQFRGIVVVITPSPLDGQEWYYFDKEVAKFGYSGDDEDNEYFNFWEATQGLATLQLDGNAFLQ